MDRVDDDCVRNCMLLSITIKSNFFLYPLWLIAVENAFLHDFVQNRLSERFFSSVLSNDKLL